MPTAVIDGARLFYRALGPRDGSPVVLIHGATADGASDWGAVAPALAIRHRVFMLDCRGHGRSTNPDGGYSFDRLAADVAGLVNRLKLGQVHVVGHSNGGNVALVLAKRYPDVLASCVIQAANAYVSPDLIEREPAIFDPARVARDDPEWRDRMIRLHGRWHGRDYWRALLRMTLAELLAAPSLSTSDLAGVQAPTLVIEGEQDPVNAPSGHGKFIAAHVPGAELWRPERVGHTVHDEVTPEWLRRVEDFWLRRGTAVGDRLWRMSAGPYRDRRTTVFDVSPPIGTTTTARAVVLEDEQERRIRANVDDHAVEVQVLRATSERLVIRAGVADVRSNPDDAAERVTQALFGEEVDAFDAHGSWRRVQVVSDGYVGWVRSAATSSSMGLMPTHRVDADRVVAYVEPDGQPVMRLPMGAVLRATTELDGWLRAGAGDRSIWLERGNLRPVAETMSIAHALERFRELVGVPYLWGGRTPWGFDCSGLSQAFLRSLGIALPRDADQQFARGEARRGRRHEGDLLFFSNPGGSADSVEHVAIALDASSFLHATGAVGAVTVNSLDRDDSAYSSPLAGAYLGARFHDRA